MSVQIFISRHGDNYFVLEDAPILLLFYFPEAPSSAIHLFKKKKHQPTNQPKPNHKTNKKKKTRENIPKDHYAKFIKASLNVARGWLNASWMMFADVIS